MIATVASNKAGAAGPMPCASAQAIKDSKSPDRKALAKLGAASSISGL